jgi:hypothetical protein
MEIGFVGDCISAKIPRKNNHKHFFVLEKKDWI